VNIGVMLTLAAGRGLFCTAEAGGLGYASVERTTSRKVSIKMEGVMSDAKKCANPVCSCVPEKGEKYCSAHCEGLGTQTEVVCKCGHGHCAGEATA
jgi:hypothetical protein